MAMLAMIALMTLAMMKIETMQMMAMAAMMSVKKKMDIRAMIEIMAMISILAMIDNVQFNDCDDCNDRNDGKDSDDANDGDHHDDGDDGDDGNDLQYRLAPHHFPMYLYSTVLYVHNTHGSPLTISPFILDVHCTLYNVQLYILYCMQSSRHKLWKSCWNYLQLVSSSSGSAGPVIMIQIQ